MNIKNELPNRKDFFSKLKNKYPDNDETERIKKDFLKFDIKNGVKLTEFHLKIDVVFLAEVFKNFFEGSIKEFDNNVLYFLGLPGYTWECGLNYTGINLQNL